MKLAQQFGALSVIGCAILASQPVQAAEPFVNPDWANHAWYAGAGVGASRATIDQARIEAALRGNGSSMVSFATDDHLGRLVDLLAPGGIELDADGAATVPLEGYGYRWLRLVTPDDHRLN